jgi:hypothetical protein
MDWAPPINTLTLFDITGQGEPPVPNHSENNMNEQLTTILQKCIHNIKNTQSIHDINQLSFDEKLQLLNIYNQMMNYNDLMFEELEEISKKRK